jgi:hypothetical protein
MQEIIGLAGNKGSGKDTASKVLIEKHGFKPISLALPLKKLVGAVFDIPFENLDDPALKEKPFEKPLVITNDKVYEIVRRCSNLLDLAKFRKSEENVLKYMNKRIVSKTTLVQTPQGPFQQKEYKSFETPRKLLQFVGTDLIRDCISPYFWCKVLDEAIKNDNKVVITDVRFFEEREYVKVKRGTLVKIERGDQVSKDGHASENSLGGNNEYHFLIRNNGTVPQLLERLDAIYTYSDLVKQDKIYVVKA